MVIKETVSLGKAAHTKLLADETLSKSAKIKRLFQAGYSIKQISEELGIRYNFAYNVVSNWVITESVEVVKPVNKESKKELIVEQFKQGNTLKEISVNLRTNYNYVFNVVKKYKQSISEEQAE